MISASHLPKLARLRTVITIGLAVALTVALVGCGNRTPEQIADDELKAGLTAIAAGDEAGAVAHYQTCLKNDPANKFCLYNLGVHAGKGGELIEAENYYRLALAQDPDFPSALFNLGLLMHAGGDLRQAAQLLGKYVTLQPTDPDGHVKLGLVLRDSGDDVSADAQFAAALQLDPQVVIPTPAATPEPTPSPTPPSPSASESPSAR